MTMPDHFLPKGLLDRLNLDARREVARGRLGNRLIRVLDHVAGPAYLKIGKGVAGQDSLDESNRLEWIGDKLPVPRILYRTEHEGWVYLLINELPGIPSHEALAVLSVQTAIEKLAEGLRMIHALPTEGCPFDRILENELEESARRVNSPGLNVEAFVADTGANPGKVLDHLMTQAIPSSNLVFTHGDYCFPNLMLDGGRISGILDWGIAGIGDRHRDFLSCELTIKRNCGEEWVPAFYEAYGATEVDPERIRFFWLLDRFFSHYEDSPGAGEPGVVS